ncbi:MAG: carbamoyltransferase HypF, partial [Firmicutes bacterium]|nr:carbamoyltransferase HypF [Bacillota bacterium]
RLLRRGAIIAFVTEDILAKVSPNVIAARFHNTIVNLVVSACKYIRNNYESPPESVALSGGVFQNRYLLSKAGELLEESNFRVLTHKQVPANDGGISFGQAAIASQIYLNS